MSPTVFKTVEGVLRGLVGSIPIRLRVDEPVQPSFARREVQAWIAQRL